MYHHHFSTQLQVQGNIYLSNLSEGDGGGASNQCDQEGVAVGVQGGVMDSVSRGVEEGVQLPGLGVAGEVPALAQQAQGEEEKEGEVSHGTELLE